MKLLLLLHGPHFVTQESENKARVSFFSGCGFAVNETRDVLSDSGLGLRYLVGTRSQR